MQTSRIMASPSGAAACRLRERSSLSLTSKLSPARSHSASFPNAPRTPAAFRRSKDFGNFQTCHACVVRTGQEQPIKQSKNGTYRVLLSPLKRTPFSKPLPHESAKTLRKCTTRRTPTILAASKQAAKTSFVSWSGSQSADLRGLEQWLQKAGLPPQKVVIEEVGEGQGRGLVAVQGLRKGDTVLTVPSSFLFTADKAYETPDLGPLLHAANVPDWPALAIFLLYEKSKGPSSDWAAYIAALPRQTGCVLEWPEGQVANFLAGSPLQAKARLCVRDVEESFRDLSEVLFSQHPKVFPPKVFTPNNFKWAFSILFSRLVRLPSLGDAVSLAPFADMANHSVDATTFFEFDARAGAVVLKADRNYEKGQQVFVSYGPRSSGDLLLSYGFVPKLDTNPHESVDLPFDPSPSTSQNSPPAEAERFPIRLTGMPEQLWDAARQKAQEVSAGDEGSQGSLELSTRELLLEAVQRVLKGYKKSLEDDEALAEAPTSDDSLNAVSLTQREIAAATVRVIERRVLYRTEAVLRGEIRSLKQKQETGGNEGGRERQSRGFLSRITGLFS
ncbi:hypothetical protein KFL_002870110 [Klebsormidium nitens]|uniref:SET domain-containing protein n=1 Tax=Klebsormidium nitens TaxID=105231 RepID=A0A1Y1ICF1_KLENI|nr:hypothetical protein KFL_002870110 [Klebsormidium nitens]|eukprot:GAQ86407.1 hypothetical protein KFL_002870110 [Klebsormidium nitens]